jgi:hypothetical protein
MRSRCCPNGGVRRSVRRSGYARPDQTLANRARPPGTTASCGLPTATQPCGPPVCASWDRAHSRGLNPDRHLPRVELSDEEVRLRRKKHQMASVWPVLLSTLGSAASEPGHLLSPVMGRVTSCGFSATPLHAVPQNAPGLLLAPGGASRRRVPMAWAPLALRKPFQVRALPVRRGGLHLLGGPDPGSVHRSGDRCGRCDLLRRDTRSLALPLMSAPPPPPSLSTVI